MKASTTWWSIVLVLGLLIHSPLPGRCSDSDPILEQYRFAIGQSTDGVTLELHDQYFGGGTARCWLSLVGRKSGVALQMRVRRTVRPGEIVFALLVFRVKVRGYDGGGKLKYSRDLSGFAFGDSSSGDWRAGLDSLPPGIREIQVVFVGNYE